MTEIRNNNEIEFSSIKDIIDMVQPYSIHDRITELELRPDRADVITHAGKIYLSIIISPKTSTFNFFILLIRFFIEEIS